MMQNPESDEPRGSYAFEDQEQFEAPPEIKQAEGAEEGGGKKRKRGMVILGGVVGLVLLLLIVVLAAGRRADNGPVVEAQPSPLPTRGPSLMEQELGRLEQLVEQADPAEDMFAPPPVDMEVDF